MDIVSKINGDTLSATEFNEIPVELETVITTSGQTPASGTLNQVATGIASYAAQGSVFGTDSGGADAYVFTQISPFLKPYALTNGFTIKFRPGNANSGGACAINACAFGNKSVKAADGTTNPPANIFNTSSDIELRYDGTVFRLTGSSTIAQATEFQAGIAEIATQAEVLAGTNDTTILTPLKLRAQGKLLVQTLSSVTGAYDETPNNIPYDDTIPQITEGKEFTSVSITPKSASSIFKITLFATMTVNGNNDAIIALFKDSNVNALAAVNTEISSADRSIFQQISYEISAGSTSAQVFRMRYGGSGGTASINGEGGARKLGGVLQSGIIIEEYL